MINYDVHSQEKVSVPLKYIRPADSIYTSTWSHSNTCLWNKQVIIYSSFSSIFVVLQREGRISLCFVTLNCFVQFIFTDVSMELRNMWCYLYKADFDDKETSYSCYPPSQLLWLNADCTFILSDSLCWKFIWHIESTKFQDSDLQILLNMTEVTLQLMNK